MIVFEDTPHLEFVPIHEQRPSAQEQGRKMLPTTSLGFSGTEARLSAECRFHIAA